MLEAESTKSASGLYGGQSGEPTLLPMKSHQVLDIKVTHAIAVGKAEGPVTEMVAHTLQTASRHRRFASIDQSNFPGLDAVGQEVHLSFLHLEGHIGHVQDVIREILFNDMTFITAAYNEFIDPMEGLQLHDVPQDRFPADLDHRLWFDEGFLAQSGAKTPG